MRILYDGLIYAIQPTGGINRYFANIISRLPASFNPCLTVFQEREVNYPAHPNLKLFKCRRFRPERVSFRLARHYFRHVAASNHFDIAHPTYYSLLTQKEVGEYRCPVVITVHDMIHELFPAMMDQNGRHAEEKRRAILAASAIICVSENTKKDLLERYPLPDEKITVVHHATEMTEELSHGPEEVPSRPYFLYVGARAGYKNFDSLLFSFAKASAAQPDVSLCVVGPRFSGAEEKTIAELKLTERVEHYGHVDDGHLAKLYNCSVAFVYPSLYEGFGIPLLEAMSCGTAVIASNRSSIPEVVGDAGLLFDPSAPDELTEMMLWLIEHPAQRERLIDRGRERAQEFSWDKTVSRTLEVYRSLAG